MKIFWTLLRRELASFFFSLTGYVIIAAVTFLVGESFAQLIDGLGTDPWPMPVTQMFFGSLYFWMIVLLVAPVITMRLFALEKASGTFETLMTTPVGDIQVVAAKFAAALFFYVAMWLPLLVCLLIVGRFTNQANALDSGTVGGMYLGILLAGGFFVSFGCLASALTRSQMVAALISLLLSLLFIVAGFWRPDMETSSSIYQLIYFFSVPLHFSHDFTRGLVDTRHLVLYVSVAVFCLFLTVRSLEIRRWR